MKILSNEEWAELLRVIDDLKDHVNMHTTCLKTLEPVIMEFYGLCKDKDGRIVKKDGDEYGKAYQ